MSLARTAAGSSSSMLRRLAAVPDARRRAAAAAATTSSSTSITIPQWQQYEQLQLRQRQNRHSQFHTSAPRPARRRRRFNSIHAAKMGLIDEESITKFTNEHFPSYTEEEKEALAKKYTPSQMAAIEAGDKAIDPRDLTLQGRFRTEAQSIGYAYLDDFAETKPVIDKPEHLSGAGPKYTTAGREKTAANVELGARFMNHAEFSDHFIEWLETFVPKNVNLENLSYDALTKLAEKHQPKPTDLQDWLLNQPAMMTRDGKKALSKEAWGESAMARSLGKYIPGVTEEYDAAKGDKDVDPDLVLVTKKTGMTEWQAKRIMTRVLVIRQVHNQTRLGKVRSVSALAIAGNGDGWLGMGMAKSVEHLTAVMQAKQMAMVNMRPIRRYEKRTVYGKLEGKVGATIVRLEARPPGFGLRVPHRIFDMARAVGITDLAAKIPRSRNPMNTVKAAYEALVGQPDPEEIAIGRGKKLVDARKVYYGGAVY